MNRFLILLAVPALLAASLALAGHFLTREKPSPDGKGPAPRVAPSGEGYVGSIASNCCLHLGGLSIGAGNFWVEEYVDQAGVARRGPTCHLSVCGEAGKFPEPGGTRLYPGKEFTAGKYRVRILDVRGGGRAGSVEIEMVPDPRDR